MNQGREMLKRVARHLLHREEHDALHIVLKLLMIEFDSYHHCPIC
jgi:hypothetical protein